MFCIISCGCCVDLHAVTLDEEYQSTELIAFAVEHADSGLLVHFLWHICGNHCFVVMLFNRILYCDGFRINITVLSVHTTRKCLIREDVLVC